MHTVTRRFCSALCNLALAATAVWSIPLSAQTWPSKPIRIVVPFPAGQGADIITRIVGERLGLALGQPIVVDNRPGAGSMLGSEFAARAAPDGYTLLAAGSSALAINPHLYSKLSFNPAKDFDPIAQVVSIEYVLVARSGLNVKNVAQLLEAARARPDKITYGSSGNGSTNHLVMAQFAASTRTNFLHVPYKGSAGSMADLLGGQIDLLIESVAVISPYLKSDKMTVLGVTGAKRSALLPGVATLEEQGVKDFDYGTWTGFVAPAGTPPGVLERVNAEIDAILKMPDVRKKIEDIGMVPIGGSREQFRHFVAAESDKWRQVVKVSGVKLD